MNKKLKIHITKQIKRVYPKQKNGDCYEINSTVAHYLYYLKYDVQIIQGYAHLDRFIYDKVLKENNPKTKGITQSPDHCWIRINRQNYDFASKVFGKAKILSYSRALDTLYGTRNKKLYKLFKTGMK